MRCGRSQSIEDGADEWHAWLFQTVSAIFNTQQAIVNRHALYRDQRQCAVRHAATRRGFAGSLVGKGKTSALGFVLFSGICITAQSC